MFLLLFLWMFLLLVPLVKVLKSFQVFLATRFRPLLILLVVLRLLFLLITMILTLIGRCTLLFWMWSHLGLALLRLVFYP
jgi:hypothetical protein